MITQRYQPRLALLAAKVGGCGRRLQSTGSRYIFS